MVPGRHLLANGPRGAATGAGAIAGAGVMCGEVMRLSSSSSKATPPEPSTALHDGATYDSR